MSADPRLNYASILLASVRIFRARGWRPLWAALAVAAPFLLLNALVNANHTLAYGLAAQQGRWLEPGEMRALWLSVTAGDFLAFLALTVAMVVVAASLRGPAADGGLRQIVRALRRLLRSPSFWLVAPLQAGFFLMINTPDGRLKLTGMVFFAASVLFLVSRQDPEPPPLLAGLRRGKWTAWLHLLPVFALFPFWFILFNGYVNYVLLILTDLGARPLAHLFAPGSAALPFLVVSVSKFCSQWFNLPLMATLLCAYLALRRRAASDT